MHPALPNKLSLITTHHQVAASLHHPSPPSGEDTGCWKSPPARDTRGTQGISRYSPSAGSAHSLYCSGVQKGASPAWKGQIHQWAPATAAARDLGPLGSPWGSQGPCFSKVNPGWGWAAGELQRNGLFLQTEEGTAGNTSQWC